MPQRRHATTLLHRLIQMLDIDGFDAPGPAQDAEDARGQEPNQD